MTKSNFGTKVAANMGCDSEPENASESYGHAAETGEDLAAERSGKEPIESAPIEQLSTDKSQQIESQPDVATLDPICGMAVKEDGAPHVERDGKMFFFCSDQCRKQFLSTIAGVKSESKAGSCCG